MFYTRSFFTSLILLLIPDLSHADQLSSLQIESINMRHILTWSRVNADCLYSVMFQGSFEVLRNNSWMEVEHCQMIVLTECDLTLDLASDSDYSIGVEAQCDGQTSWTQLPKMFNRRDTKLLPSNMSVKMTEGRIEVFFSEVHRDISRTLKIWKKGDEQNVNSTELSGPQAYFDVEQDGETYCLKAEVRLETFNRSNSTETQCVTVFKPDPSWIKFLIVGIAVALTFAVVMALGLMTSRYGPRLREIWCHKKTLPGFLFTDWPEYPLTFNSRALLETTHLITLLPLNQQNRRSEIQEC